ncbi:hypothetical protein ACIGO9_30950 [Nocardia asteroides]|uniref:hypothetical protein n=1 Tax=Nocardia asteroides TaxID=1824 RepID=UPI0037C6E6F8
MNDPVLLPPTISDDEVGLVLDIADIGVHNPLPLAGEVSYLYLRCPDGSRYRVPSELHDWATRTLAEHHASVQTGVVPVLPAAVEFGVIGQQTFARQPTGSASRTESSGREPLRQIVADQLGR